jgi:chromosome segregation ATPase
VASRIAVHGQLERTRVRMAVAQAQFRLARLNDEIVCFEDKRLLKTLQKKKAMARCRFIAVDAVCIPPSLFGGRAAQTLFAELSHLEDALAMVEADNRRLDSAVEKVTLRGAPKARSRAAGVNKQIADAGVQLQRLEKRIQDAERREAELKSLVQELRSQKTPDAGEFRRNITECSALLAARLVHIQTLEITLENYHGRILKWRAELQSATTLEREIARLKQEIGQARSQTKAPDSVEIRIQTQLEAEAATELKALDARGKAAAARIRHLVSAMMKQRLPIPSRLQASFVI